MDRWYWTSPTYLPGEEEKLSVAGKRLYDGDNKTNYEDGDFIITNVRLLWRYHSHRQSLGLNLELVVLVEEEAGNLFSHSKLVIHVSSRPCDQPSGPFAHSSHVYIKISLKSADLQLCMSHLQTALCERAWESSKFQQRALLSPNAESVKGSKSVRVGILGIERDIETKQQATSQSITQAFEDLKMLMSQAKEMVALSHNIATVLKERDRDGASDETSQFRSCLLRLGIDDPVTRDAVGSTTEYHQKLSREICSALETPIREAGGMMLLSEVYCRINRARGLHLLSPEDVAYAVTLLKPSPMAKYPLTLHSFSSGVQVLQLSTLDVNTLVSATRQLLEQHCGAEDSWHGVSAGEMSRLSGLPLMLSKERLLLCEQQGLAVRDESSEGLSFYPNYFDRINTEEGKNL